MTMDATPGEPATPSARQLEELQLLLNGYRISQAIYVVARLLSLIHI